MTDPTRIKATPPVKGMPPLANPIVAPAIEARLRADYEERSAEHEANRSENPARLRASDAYACARKVGFTTLRVPKPIDLDGKTLMTFRAGDFYHDLAQKAMAEATGMRIEVPFDYRPEHDLYGKADGETDDAAVELKSQASYGFQLAVGTKKRPDGPGPKIDHLIQVGLAAMSPQINKQKVLIVYFDKDQGTVGEWLFDIDEPLKHLYETETGYPTVRVLVMGELFRLDSVLDTIDEGLLPTREIPGYGIVERPPAPGSRDEPWNCRYCPWQPTCAQLPTGPTDLALLEPFMEAAS